VTAALEGHPRSGWDDLVVICAANNWDDVKRGDRHMAERLVEHAPILYVDPPQSHLTRFGGRTAFPTPRPRLRPAAPGIARYTPVVAPKPMHPRMVGTTARIVRRELAGAVRRLGGSVHAVITTWLFVDAYGVCDERRRVYWWRDDPVAAAHLWGFDAERLARGEERLARSSDVLVAVSADAARRWAERGVPTAFLPNGCDAEAFAAVDEAEDPTDVDLPGPVAGFVGQINDRTDLALLEAVADTGMSLLIVGPRDPSYEPERFGSLVARPNVAYVGPRPFDALAPYLKLIDVGLVPYAMSEFNRGSFPLKALEYLAAGRPVVATPLPALRWLDTDLVELHETPYAFATATRQAAVHARDPVRVERRRALAARHSWSERAERMAQLLELPGHAAELEAA
jgi:glycosyltransferase involved in cell wall biosynthesis